MRSSWGVMSARVLARAQARRTPALARGPGAAVAPESTTWRGGSGRGGGTIHSVLFLLKRQVLSELAVALAHFRLLMARRRGACAS